MNIRQCSRKLPKPIRLISRGKNKFKYKVRYVIFPDLARFKKACKTCKFRMVSNDSNGKKSRCKLEDPDFMLKFYHGKGLNNKNIWIGAVPPILEKRWPELYADIVSFLGKHRARGLENGVLLVGRKAGQTKPVLTDGRDILLCSFKRNRDRFEDIENS